MTMFAPSRSPDFTPVRLTVEQYHRMIRAGMIGEGAPIELLDGMLVLIDRSHRGEDPMSVGEGHRWATHQLSRVLAPVRHLGCDIQTQQPVVLLPDGEPEPDGAIIRAAADDYRGRKPGPADVLCVIEVADNSLETDRTTKLRIYAEASVPQYVIINLVDRVAEDYRQPRPKEGKYAKPLILRPGQSVSFSCGEGRAVEVPVEKLLP